MAGFDTFDVAAILFAGLAAGFVITAIGAGSLISFPILLAVGLPPVTANASNTVGLVPGGLSGSWGYRHELVGKKPKVTAVALTSAGGAIGGALLLLVLPPGAFEAIVPVLILLGTFLVGVQPLISRWARRRAEERDLPTRERARGLPPPLAAISSLLGVYGGYFGAGQGVMLVAFLAIGLDERMQVVNGLKNVAVLSANVAATVVFVFAAPLDWTAVALVAVGSVIGGWLGAIIGRRLPATVFRVLVVLMGTAVGVRLLLT